MGQKQEDTDMREATIRATITAVAFAVLAASCSGDSGPTTTRFTPPSSEAIFELSTTTSRPPGPLDPVHVESLAVTVDIPRDWEFETESLRFGRASAAFRADNDSGGLIVVGTVEDVVETDANAALPDDLAPILATLFDVEEPLPANALRPQAEPPGSTVGGVAYTLSRYFLTESSGTTATMEIAVYADTNPVVFIAVLYQDTFPEDRIEQARVFQSLARG
jgi:hypothetical protein